MPPEQIEKFRELIEKYPFSGKVTFDSSIINIDNDIYFITDENGDKYVIREAKRVRDKDALFEANLLDSLIRHHFMTPRIVRLKDGSLFTFTKTKWPVFVFEFIKGKQIEADQLGKDLECYTSLGGKALGRIHKIASADKKSIGDNKARNIFTEIDAVLALSPDVFSHVKGFDIFTDEIRAFKAKAQSYMESNPEKCGAIHNDYGIQNTIFNEQGCYVIDFDWSCYGPFIKDVGQGVALWSAANLTKGIEQDIIKYFLEGYNEEAPFPVKLDQELLFWICFSCLSDACTFFIGFLDNRFPGVNLNRVEQCHGYKRYMLFKGLLL